LRTLSRIRFKLAGRIPALREKTLFFSVLPLISLRQKKEKQITISYTIKLISAAGLSISKAQCASWFLIWKRQDRQSTPLKKIPPFSKSLLDRHELQM